MDIAQLIREAKHGSTAAQKCLFDLFADNLLLMCRRYVKSQEDAEEILLDGYYKFLMKLPSFNYQGEVALRSFLKRILINECLMFLRRKHAFGLVSESAAAEVAIDETTISALSAAEIFNLIVQLPVGYRTVFNLYAVEGFNHGEIAAMLNIAEGTSKSQLSKARAQLQKMILQNEKGYEKRTR